MLPPAFDVRLDRIAWFLKNWEQGDRHDVGLCHEARQLAEFVCGKAPIGERYEHWQARLEWRHLP